MPMTIATWNVNSLRARMGHVLDWIDRERPDVLMLQETKVEDALFPLDDFLSRGYYVQFFGQKSYNGVATLSRLPQTHVRCGLDGTEESGARVLRSTVQAPWGPVRLVNVYAVNGEMVGGEKWQRKERFFARLTESLCHEAGPLVLGGDLNIAHRVCDVDDVAKREGDVLFTPTERAWLSRLMEEATLYDALRLVSDAAGIFSWWDYRAGAVETNRGLRIDYVLVDEALRPRVQAVRHFKDERTKDKPSDHIPVMVVLA